MALQTLKPRLQTRPGNRVATLDTKAGIQPRQRGTTLQNTRKRIAEKHGWMCSGCGLVWRMHIDQVDHIIPLEDGGSNDDSNLQLLCNVCHRIKTDCEAKARAGHR